MRAHFERLNQACLGAARVATLTPMLPMSSALCRGVNDAWIDAGRQDFFEPVVCIGVIVEATDFAIPGRAIQVESLGERSIRVEPNGAHLASRRHPFEFAEESASESEATRSRRNPHALDLTDTRCQSSDGAAAHRLSEEPGDEEAAFGSKEILYICSAIQIAAKAPNESRPEFVKILIKAPLRGGTRRIRRCHLDARGA